MNLCACVVQGDAEDVIGPLSDREAAEKLRAALLLNRGAAALYKAVPLDLPLNLEVCQRSPLLYALSILHMMMSLLTPETMMLYRPLILVQCHFWVALPCFGIRGGKS